MTAGIVPRPRGCQAQTNFDPKTMAIHFLQRDFD
jgi:hypothetical protein